MSFLLNCVCERLCFFFQNVLSVCISAQRNVAVEKIQARLALWHLALLYFTDTVFFIHRGFVETLHRASGHHLSLRVRLCVTFR